MGHKLLSQVRHRTYATVGSGMQPLNMNCTHSLHLVHQVLLKFVSMAASSGWGSGVTPPVLGKGRGCGHSSHSASSQRIVAGYRGRCRNCSNFGRGLPCVPRRRSSLRQEAFGYGYGGTESLIAGRGIWTHVWLQNVEIRGTNQNRLLLQKIKTLLRFCPITLAMPEDQIYSGVGGANLSRKLVYLQCVGTGNNSVNFIFSAKKLFSGFSWTRISYVSWFWIWDGEFVRKFYI